MGFAYLIRWPFIRSTPATISLSLLPASSSSRVLTVALSTTTQTQVGSLKRAFNSLAHLYAVRTVFVNEHSTNISENYTIHSLKGKEIQIMLTKHLTSETNTSLAACYEKRSLSLSFCSLQSV